MGATWLYRAAVAVGVGLCVVAMIWIRSGEALARAAALHPAMTPVLVARLTVPAGSPLSPAEFAVETMPAADVPTGALTASVVLSGAVARQTLWAGEPVVDGMIYPTAAQAALDARLPAGMRAVDVAVSGAAGMGGLLVPGDHVDVVFVQSGASAHASVLLVDVPVLGVVGGASGTAAVAGTSTPGSYTSVVLETTPRQAVALALAQSAGPITLVLRNTSDATWSAPTVTLAGLNGGIR